MCDNAIPENVGTLKSVPDCYKNEDMSNKGMDNYPHALDFVPECYKTQILYDKAVNTYPSTIKFISEWLMTQEICDRVVNRCFLCLTLFLININLKKCLTELFLKITF